MSGRDLPIDLAAFDVGLSRLAVTTAERSDAEIHRCVGEVLRLVRDHLQMDVVFVSRFENGRRVFRHVEQDANPPLLAVGNSDPLEMSFCQRVVDGRLPELVNDVAALPNLDELPPLPFRIGAHLSTPLVLGNGEVYGTFCCFSFTPDGRLGERHLKRLRMASEMTARLIERSSADFA